MPIRNVGLVLVVALFAAVPGPAQAQSAKARYDQAKARERELTNARRTPPLSQLRETVRSFEQIPRRFPTSGYADDALYWGALLAFDAYRHYEDDADREAGIQMLEWLIREYPHSPLLDQARAHLAREGTAPAADTPALATLQRIHRVNLPDAVRITIELDREITFAEDTLEGPPRFFVDLHGVKSDPHQRGVLRSDQADDVLREIRVGTQSPTVTRVVLEFSEQARHEVSTLTDPYRLVIDVPRRAEPVPQPFPTAGRRTTPPATAEPTPVEMASAPPEALFDPIEGMDAASLEPPGRDASPDEAAGAGRPAPTPSAFPQAARRGDAPVRPTPQPMTAGPADRAAHLPPPVSSSAGRPPAAPEAPGPAAADAPRAAAIEAPPPALPPVPRAPEANAEGGFSLGRQLGLGVARVVIDPGHGGHDPGTTGHGVVEKELVLDVALRLEQLLKAEGIDVVMTRRTDVFIPLEERTAIANRHQADLFLSIHANASRNRQARGIETYFLSFASDKAAEEVAARENATSGQAMHNLPKIVEAITLNNKLDESRDFAEMVQHAMISGLRATDHQVEDRGVKRAPFIVLIGASMPSVLAEISFVSHQQEAALLRTSAYRQEIADALRRGVLRYQRSLQTLGTVAEQ